MFIIAINGTPLLPLALIEVTTLVKSPQKSVNFTYLDHAWCIRFRNSLVIIGPC